MITVALDNLAVLIGPLSMLIIGMLMAEQSILKIFTCKKAYLIALLRLLVLPIVVVISFKIVGCFIKHQELDTIMVIVLWSISSPIGSMISQFCQLYGEDSDYVGQMTLLSVVLCLISMPLIPFLI